MWNKVKKFLYDEQGITSVEIFTRNSIMRKSVDFLQI